MANTIGERVAAELTRFGWNQKELVRRSGLAASAVSQIIRDDREPSAGSLVKLATALDVTADYLLGLRRDPDAPLVARIHCPSCGKRHYVERV